ncbi:family 16 glycoside hydrolase [Paenibacillus silviterrae]|uniref:family 16 glycoside hydrolase n=1 Tax=Paenibacillus silviterrae TaxID=3242194 RepID=UPI0025435281|nr:family 16 glycoside hydrolase [Paenibacillus chinjuensis]
MLKPWITVGLAVTLAVTSSSVIFPSEAEAAMAVIRVSDYGAVPGDENADGQAIRAALDAAVRIAGGAEVVFDPGRYIVDPPKREWNFDADGTTDGWTLGGSATGTAGGGSLQLTLAGASGQLTTPDGAVTIDGSRFVSFKVRMSNATTATQAALWWTTQEDASWNTARSQTFPVTASSTGFTEYKVDLSQHPEWNGKMIKNLRILPAQGAASGSVSIDRITVDTAAPIEWAFPTGNAEGWNWSGLTGGASGGVLKMTASGASPKPYVVSAPNLQIPTSPYNTVTVRMKNYTGSTQAELRYITNEDTVWNDKKAVPFTITANNADFQEYKISLSSLHYYGTLKQLRLYPIGETSSGSVDIDTVRFEQPDSLTSNFYFHYKGATQGLTVTGGGAELEFTEPFYGAFKFFESSNISISGFAMDYKNPPFTQGVIAGCNAAAATIDFVPDTGYAYILDDPRTPLMPSKWGVIRDPANSDLQKEKVPNVVTVQSWQKLSGTTYRLQLSPHLASKMCIPGYIEVNDKFAFSYRSTGYNMFDLRNDSNVALSDITVYRGAGTTVTSQNLDGTAQFTNINVLRRTPGQVMTTPADGLHMQFSVNGPIVRNSTFEGMLDDAINFYQAPTHLIEPLAPNRIYVKLNGIYSIGDTIQVLDADLGRIRGTAKIIGMDSVGTFPLKSRAIWTLDRDIVGMIGGDDLSTADSIYNLTKNFNNYEVSGSTFRESRRNGVLVRPGSNGVIKNNRFTDLGGAGIAVQNEPGTFAHEGPMAEQLLIEGNYFARNNYLTDINSAAKGGKLTAGGIQIFAQKKDKQVADSRGIKQITLRGNTIESPIRSGILIAGVDGVTMEGTNTITAVSGDPVLDGDISAVRVENAANVTLNGLRVVDPRPELNAGVQLGTSVDALQLGTAQFQLAAGVPGVLNMAPSAPTGLVADASNGSAVHLNWNDAPGAIRYNIYRSTAPFNPSWETRLDCCARSSEVWDTGLSGSKTYYYRVTAVNEQGYESAATPEVTAVTQYADVMDGFDDGNAAGWTPSGGTWSVVQDGGSFVYQQSSLTGDIVNLVSAAPQTGGSVEARIRMTAEGASSTGAGLIVRYVDADNYYWVNLRRSAGTLRLMKKSGGVWSQVASAALPQELNRWYHLRAELQGDAIQVYVDGELKLNTSDASHPGGAFGFRVYNTAVQFDDVKAVYGMPSPGPKAPYTETFEDGIADGWTTYGGVWSVAAQTDGSKAYKQSATGGDVMAIQPSTVNDGDYTVEAKVRMDTLGTGSTGAGLAFRMKDTNNFYWLNLRPNQNDIRLMKKVGGVWSQVGSTAPLTQALGVWYTVKVAVSCDAIVAYVNGTKVFETSDASLLNGGVGFRMYNTSASVDDISVTYEP